MTLIETLYHKYEGTDAFRMSLYIQINSQNQPQLPVESHLGAFYGVLKIAFSNCGQNAVGF